MPRKVKPSGEWNSDKITAKLYWYRTQCQMTQEQMANALHISKNTYASFELEEDKCKKLTLNELECFINTVNSYSRRNNLNIQITLNDLLSGINNDLWVFNDVSYKIGLTKMAVENIEKLQNAHDTTLFGEPFIAEIETLNAILENNSFVDFLKTITKLFYDRLNQENEKIYIRKHYTELYKNTTNPNVKEQIKNVKNSNDKIYGEELYKKEILANHNIENETLIFIHKCLDSFINKNKIKKTKPKKDLDKN